MSRKNIYTSIYKLNISSIDELKNKLKNKKSYVEELPHPKNDKYFLQLSNSEKSYYRRWDYISKNNYSITFNNININYTLCTAKIEYHTKTIKSKGGQYLPKKDRVNIDYVKCYFFEKNKLVYAIIITSNLYNRIRTKQLLDYSIGSASIENPKEFLLNNDIFNWMFYLYQDHKGVITKEISINEIGGFVGNIVDNTNIISGTSDQTLDLVVTKAFISNGGILKTITFRLRDEKNAEISCSIDTQASSIINLKESVNLQILIPTPLDEYLIIYLYGYLIEVIKNKYSKAKQNFKKTQENDFKKKIGLNVINSIMQNNSISKNEI